MEICFLLFPWIWYQSNIELIFPGGSAGEETACNVGDSNSTPGQENPLEKDVGPLASIFA